MLIFIKTISEKKILLNVKSTDTIGYIKKQIYDEEIIHPNLQKLFLKNVELNDNNKTLNDYSIMDEDVLRLRWGL